MAKKGFAAIRERLLDTSDQPRLLEQNGRLELDGLRMMMLSEVAFCELRAEIINCLGLELARGVLKRCGFQAGFRDGHLLRTRYPALDLEAQMHLGTLLHQKEGWARVESLPETRVDLEAGVLEIVSRWHSSIEAEQHRQRFPLTDEPTCWMMAGYASGHLSYLLERNVIAVETDCAASGRPHCDFRVGFRDEMEIRFPGCGDDYRRIELYDMLADLRGTISRQEAEIDRLRTDRRPGHVEGFGHMIYESRAMERAVSLAISVARVDSTVLINGESGTGKELLAKGIHDQSSRADETFHAINCATLTESLQNAELFGYACGAFTGANRDKPGIFEATDGGTLFLDEIGELSLSAQASLLRVLQEGQVVRIGETRVREVDVRIIAATHRDLDAMLEAGTFRRDLFFRLNVLQVRLPPLRERDNDILLLAHHFVAIYAKRFEKPRLPFHPRVRHLFSRYPWPGNVRELQNAIERAVLLSSPPQIVIDDLPDCLVSQLTPIPDRDPAPEPAPTADDERSRLAAMLRETSFNRGEAARRLGMGRTTLWRKMKRYGL